MFLRSVSYVFLSAISTVSGIILFPLFIKFLEPIELGYYSLIVSCTTFATLLSGLGLYNGMSNFYFDLNLEGRRKLLNNLFCSTSLVNVFLAFIFSFIITFSELYQNEIGILLSLAIILGFTDSLVALFFQFLRNEGQNNKFLILSGSSIGINLTLTCLMLIAGWGLWSAVMGKLIVSICIVIYVILKHIKFDIDTEFLKPILNYSLKLLPVLILGWVFQYSDRFLAEYFLSEKEFGNFGFVISASAIIMTGFLAIGNSVQPELYFAFKENNSTQIKQVINHYLMIILTGTVMGLILLGGIHAFWPQFNYHVSIPALILYSGGFFLLAHQHLYNMELIYFKKVRLLTIYQNLSYASYSCALLVFFSLGSTGLLLAAVLFFTTRIFILGFYLLLQKEHSLIIKNNKNKLLIGQGIIITTTLITFYSII